MLSPRWQVSGAGYVLVELTKPGTAVPLLVALAALLALSLLPRQRHRTGPAVARDPAEGEGAGVPRPAVPHGARP